ncbi:unnamed protein product [Oncorhynchus mykiss]|uniref:Uncharacterized protein n=1 Tax=Oncorhynchus mykiss TaxID=8022 RepID=A0A060X0A7_ONCMY|nr:unnamed protein product [Oncorhynchus mykiss]
MMMSPGQTVCVVLWVASYSASVLRPLKSSLQKKKKKTKDSSTAMPVVLSGFQEWTGSLQGIVTQALDHVKGQEASLTALKLAALTLGVGHAQTQEECGFTRAAMDKVQTSYLGSLQELGDLLRKRADSLKSLNNHHHPSINIVIPNYHYYTGSPHLTAPPAPLKGGVACYQQSFTSWPSFSTSPSLWVSLYITQDSHHHCSLSARNHRYFCFIM